MNILKEVQRRLAKHQLYSQQDIKDPVVYCKLFDVFGSGTWYLTEFDGIDTAFGFVTGLVQDEWGYMNIPELQAIKLRGTIPRIDCDLWFEPTQFSVLKIKARV